MIRPSTSIPTGKMGAASHSGDWMRIARIGAPGLELYEATGSIKRIQNDLPAGTESQRAEAGEAKGKSKNNKKTRPAKKDGTTSSADKSED